MVDFIHKRHDRLPYLRTQLGHRQEDGTFTPTDLGSVQDVMFIAGLPDAQTPKVNRPARVVTDPAAGLTPADGWVEYRPAVGDTDTSGVYEVEWETHVMVEGEVLTQTFPGDGYDSWTIYDDKDVAP